MLRGTLLKMTPQDSNKDWYRVDYPEAARYLIEPRARRYLVPFIGRERTASAVADELGESVTTVLYRVKRMIGLGLIEVRRVEPRRGRGIRYYRAVSDAFFAPFQASSAASLEELFTTSLKNHQDGVIGSVARAWTKLVSPSTTWGVYAQGDADGLGTLAMVPDVRQGQSYDLLDWLADPESPAVWDNTYPLRLSHEDAKALQRDLWELQTRYAPKQVCYGKPYIVRTTLAPLEVTEGDPPIEK
jgi:hypothetical protein